MWQEGEEHVPEYRKENNRIFDGTDSGDFVISDFTDYRNCH